MLTTDDTRVRAFFAARGRAFEEPVTFLAREVAGQVVGAWAYTGYAPGESVQIHLAGSGLNRELVRVGLTYPFDQLGVKVIIAAIPGHNARALRIAGKLGFQDLATIEELDLHLHTMNRAQCRWLEAPRG